MQPSTHKKTELYKTLMTCELHTDIQSRPQLMLNAIMEIRNEIYNAREYGRSALSKKKVLTKKPTTKTPKGAHSTGGTLNLSIVAAHDGGMIRKLDSETAAIIRKLPLRFGKFLLRFGN